jgi:hypothetical protein
MRELYLVRQNDDDDAGCPFPWRVDSLRLGHILRRLPRVPQRARRCEFWTSLGHAYTSTSCHVRMPTPYSL